MFPLTLFSRSCGGPCCQISRPRISYMIQSYVSTTLIFSCRPNHLSYVRFCYAVLKLQTFDSPPTSSLAVLITEIWVLWTVLPDATSSLGPVSDPAADSQQNLTPTPHEAIGALNQDTSALSALIFPLVPSTLIDSGCNQCSALTHVPCYMQPVSFYAPWKVLTYYTTYGLRTLEQF